ncbi:MAG: hypothetical protein EAX95_02480 [Candidatus Thorarchaeota archaeon]|nr:hypothetical protein [Candidatus Thorarchaeota archaeon]
MKYIYVIGIPYVRRTSMFWKTADQVVQEEIESVRPRKVILDQLEGGSKTGKELRDAIQTDMFAQALREGMEGMVPSDFTVSDPKLYFNTKYLEDAGIITSRKDSRERQFGLTPWAIQPVRRALGVKRPILLLTSMSHPEDQRPFVAWISNQTEFDVVRLRIIVADGTFRRGASRNLMRHVPAEIEDKADSETSYKRTYLEKLLDSPWEDLPLETVGDFDTSIPGDLMATYSKIETIVQNNLPEYEVVVDLSTGPPLIPTALSLVAMNYSLTAVFIRHHGGASTVTRVLPRE